MLVIILFGIHSTKELLFLFPTFSISYSTSPEVISEPLNKTDPVKTLPYLKSLSHKWDLESNNEDVISLTPNFSYYDTPLAINGAYPIVMKWSLENGIKLVHSFLISALFWTPANLNDAVVLEIAYEAI
jgi:hypothetical protein